MRYVAVQGRCYGGVAGCLGGGWGVVAGADPMGGAVSHRDFAKGGSKIGASPTDEGARWATTVRTAETTGPAHQSGPRPGPLANASSHMSENAHTCKLGRRLRSMKCKFGAGSCGI